MFAAFGSMRDREISEAAVPMFSQVQTSNPLVPNWSFPARDGAFQRVHELIRSDYAATSRLLGKIAVRHWVRFCASLSALHRSACKPPKTGMAKSLKR